MDPDDSLPFGPEREAEEPDEHALGVVEPPARAVRRFPTAGERIRARMGEGRAVHVSTGIPTLDANTRGGLIAGRLTIIGGPPDSGKTSLAVQIAHDLTRSGYAVALHCADEDAEGIQFRIGQQVGLTLEDLEAGSEDTLSRLAAHFDALPALIIVDQDEDEATVEDTAAELVRAARAHGCSGLLLVVDSLQMARASATDDAPNIRERINATTAALKRIAKTTRALVIATCELSRAAYRSDKAKERIADMAAFKESGAVEYAMNTGIVLRPVPDTEDQVDVTLPKNKRGRRNPFRLQRDASRCSYVEVPMLPAEEGATGADVERIVAAIREHARNEGVRGADAAASLAGMSAPKGRIAVKVALSRGLIENGARLKNGSSDDRHPRYFPAADTSDTSGPKGPGRVDERGPSSPDP